MNPTTQMADNLCAVCRPSRARDISWRLPGQIQHCRGPDQYVFLRRQRGYPLPRPTFATRRYESKILVCPAPSPPPPPHPFLTNTCMVGIWQFEFGVLMRGGCRTLIQKYTRQRNNLALDSLSMVCSTWRRITVSFSFFQELNGLLHLFLTDIKHDADIERPRPSGNRGGEVVLT